MWQVQHRSPARARIPSLAQEPSYAEGGAIKKRTEQNVRHGNGVEAAGLPTGHRGGL